MVPHISYIQSDLRILHHPYPGSFVICILIFSRNDSAFNGKLRLSLDSYMYTRFIYIRCIYLFYNICVFHMWNNLPTKKNLKFSIFFIFRTCTLPPAVGNSDACPGSWWTANDPSPPTAPTPVHGGS